MYNFLKVALNIKDLTIILKCAYVRNVLVSRDSHVVQCYYQNFIQNYINNICCTFYSLCSYSAKPIFNETQVYENNILLN